MNESSLAHTFQAKLVLTTAVPLTELFLSHTELEEAIASSSKAGALPSSATAAPHGHEAEVSDVMRHLMDDLGLNMAMLRSSSVFSGEEERFAFARALSRLSEMGSREWVERGMGLEEKGGRKEMEGWQRVKSKWREDSM